MKFEENAIFAKNIFSYRTEKSFDGGTGNLLLWKNWFATNMNMAWKRDAIIKYLQTKQKLSAHIKCKTRCCWRCI